MKKIAASELILNPDGSIYHLSLKPQDIANTIITVGDPDRVAQVSNYFDTIEFKGHKREFHTHTGHYKGKKITVISSGIGPDNIDIVMNELDALVNIDLNTRLPKKEKTSLDIIRIGTSGTLQDHIAVDSFLISEYGLGLDGLMHAYNFKAICEQEIEEAFIKHTHYNKDKARPYIIKGNKHLEQKLHSQQTLLGITATANGFYGPQGRVLRLALSDVSLNNKMKNFSFKGKQITNFEMETSAIYGLAKLLGHRAISINAIIANRANLTFSEQPRKTIDTLIKYTLEHLVKK